MKWAFSAFFAENFLDILVCDMTHIKDDSLNE
jgi:hypothetical protein